MASLSISAPISAPGAIGAPVPLHARRHSRNPSAAPLPAFTFKPGSFDLPAPEVDLENTSPADDLASRGHVRRASKPPPLPDFKFNPGARLPAQPSPSPTHPVLEEMAMNQQRVSRSAKPAPLPMFTFNPGAQTAQPMPSPTRSEAGEADGHRTTGGHKRAGSEFVGGVVADGVQLINTSPQKHESKPSAFSISGPAMRGHSHRRSQAISVSDIDTSDLIKTHAIAKSRSGSNPSTPNEIIQPFNFPRQSPHARQSPSYSARSPPSSPRRRSAPVVRSRVVDFAEKIDVIPRPLSMISSETEESSSTIRGAHSLSNSINSFASPPQCSPPLVSSNISTPTLDGSPRRRPQTADPSTLMASIQSVGGVSLLHIPKRPLSASSSPAVAQSGSPPSTKKHFWFNHSDEPSPTPTPKSENGDPFERLPPFGPSQDVEKSRPKTSPERSASFRRRKYHTWTSGIFSKKSNKRVGKVKNRRIATPPTLQRPDSDQLNQIFDADDTIVLREDSPVTQRKQPSVPTPSLQPALNIDSREEMTSPMLDLDAALEPLGSEEQWGSGNNGRTAASRIAKLHSSERRGVVDAFGSIHRRTESAPNMPAVNRALFGMVRHGSNASLVEDVFDEEEEDIFLADQLKAESDDEKDTESKPRIFKSTAKNSTPAAIVGGLGLTNIRDHGVDVVIADTDEEVSEDVRSSKSTIEAPIVADEDLPKRPATSPMPLAYPSTQTHYASSTEGRTTSASLVSSPDPDHVSFDTFPRFRRNEEASPDFLLRPSTDDLPSLSDSISSGAVARVSSSANTRSSTEQRSQSMSAPTSSKSSQNWKRSSLASLNRLIPGSSHGSKLKFETVPDTNAVDPAALEEKSKKKSHRISKLMRFWRSKEDLNKR